MKKNFHHRLFNAAFGAALCGMLFTSCTKEEEIQPRLTGEDKLNSAEMVSGAQERKSRTELDAKRGGIMYDSGAQERQGRDFSNDSKNLMNHDNNIQERQGRELSNDVRSILDRDNNIQERNLGAETLDHTGLNAAGTAIGRLSASSSNAGDMKTITGKADKHLDIIEIRSDEMNQSSGDVKSLNFTPAQKGADKAVLHD